MAKILLIDDEPAYCQHIAFLLACKGHETRCAANSSEAMLLAFEFVPDLVIADWALGDRFSGGEIASALRRFNPQLRSLLITGNPEITCHSSGQSEAIDEVIAKPFNRACILAAVERMLCPPPH
ncbi:MAG TPA: response regulator [Pirellulales bacterium]|jgi:DNA-binding response OmpR family regulator|nr:response regulator [Pirellulales bacterium]